VSDRYYVCYDEAAEAFGKVDNPRPTDATGVTRKASSSVSRGARMTANDTGTTLQAWLAERYPGTYADGKRHDELGYLQCKLILKPDRITTAHVFKEFARLVHRAARE
jgi:hypothetical protein